MVWLPDSSGFIYPGGKAGEQIMFYDAAKREHRVLIEDTGAGTLIPGLSPDGKRIAVVRIRRGEDGEEAAQIVVYDWTGKESHRSAQMKWKAAGEKKEGILGTMVFWDYAGNKLLFSAPFEKEPQTGIYHPQTKQLRIVTGRLLPFGGTPIRPDGKGFLVAAGDGKVAAFIDWEGRKQELELAPEAAANDDRAILDIPWWFVSQWDGNAAVASYKEWRTRIDSKKRTVTLEKRPQAEGRVGDFNIQQQWTFPNGAKVRGLVKEHADGKFDKSRLEIITPGADKPHVLVEEGGGIFGFSPSPDKKLLAIWCVDDGTGKPYVYVVNSAGELVSDTVVHGQ
jgi:Tol biopolymer transport system component